MKPNTLLPLGLLSLTSAFAVPDPEVFEQINLSPSSGSPKSFLDRLPKAEDIYVPVKETFTHAVTNAENALDGALSSIFKYSSPKPIFCSKSYTAFDAQGWLDSAKNVLDAIDPFAEPGHPHHPHHPPHHKHPHHPHHPCNQTIYELISSSKYTTKLASLINEFPDLVQTLNGTAANYTLFAPIDSAFEKIPKGHKPSKEVLQRVLTYHVSEDFYPAGRMLMSHTIPSALKEDALGGDKQRLRVSLSLKGLTVNFYSHVKAVNIFATNGVIHGIDSILLPPPPALKVLSLLPGEFSTLSLGLQKTGLDHAIATSPHAGGTIFAPTNFAFKRLGPKINAFLFSDHGAKYLKALLQYHIVANQTLYSDAFYNNSGSKSSSSLSPENLIDAIDVDASTTRPSPPKGLLHLDLPTLLEDRSLSIDIARYGGLINMRINGYTDVAVQDGIVKDGVIQVLSNVLIPPKKLGGAGGADEEEISVQELKDRLEEFLEEECDQEANDKGKGWWEL